MKRNIVVTAAAEPLPEGQPVEIVERKGIGHPHTLYDGIAGKLYNVLALEAARAVVECVPTVRQA